jgi:hypothetical protein
MGVKSPEPPAVAQLVTLGAEVKRLDAGAELWRVYFRGGNHPTVWDAFRTYGPTSARFDHHLPPPRVQSRSILYAAESGPTCLAEVFQDKRVIDRTARQPWIASWKLSANVELLDLSGTWSTRAGASSAIHSGPRARARRWAQRIYDAYPTLSGLYYLSSMGGNAPAVALFERARPAMPPSPAFHRPLADPTLLNAMKNAAADLGYGLA